jgi:thioredoxin 2
MALDVFRCPECGAFATREVDAPSAQGCVRCGAAVPTEGAPQAVSPETLRTAIRTAPVPVLLEAWAPDCDPCLTSAVVVDAVGHRLAGAAVVLRSDIEAHPEVCDAYRILAVPTLVLFSEGRERGRRIGPVPARAIEQWVRQLAAPERPGVRVPPGSA